MSVRFTVLEDILQNTCLALMKVHTQRCRFEEKNPVNLALHHKDFSIEILSSIKGLYICDATLSLL